MFNQNCRTPSDDPSVEDADGKSINFVFYPAEL